MAKRKQTSAEEYLTFRCRQLNKAPLQRHGTDYVLCWLQQTLRGVDNPVIDAALALGQLTGKPVVVYHGLGQQYPHASDRLHRFILEASRRLEADIRARGIRFIRHVDTLEATEKGLLYRLSARAAALVLDDHAAFVGRWQAVRVANRVHCLAIAVDGARLVPEQALGGEFNTTSAFRARHTDLRERWTRESVNLEPSADVFSGELAAVSVDLGEAGEGKIDSLLARCAIDHTVAAVSWCSGDRGQALRHMVWSSCEPIAHYSQARNNPAVIGTSYLSPYLHFGVLSPFEIVDMVQRADVSARDQWRFQDELLTWREYFHHRACRTEYPAAYDNIPLHSRSSLAAHSSDKREQLYSLHDLVHGQTEDDIWNVAQRQFLIDGWMHNNLRMYWGKRLIAWTRSPEAGWKVACYLNDRFSLDGRDPATYGNMQWCFGASRPAAEVAVYGTVPRKSDRALRARSGFLSWMDQQLQRSVPTVDVPDEILMTDKPQASGAGC